MVLFKFTIDCDVDPYIPGGWSVEEHRKGTEFVWNGFNVSLYLSAYQQGGRNIRTEDLRRELADKPVLNANVLDALLDYPQAIPESWKGRHVFFWGTIYRSRSSRRYVRFLYWRSRGWSWGYRWLEREWGGYDLAAVRRGL